MGCGASKSPDIPPEQEPLPPQNNQRQYVPPTDFPTPKLLAECQEEYLKIENENSQRSDNDGQPNNQEAVDDDGNPNPRPPAKRKRDIFDRNEYSSVREDIAKASKKLATSPLSILAEHLQTLADDTLGQLYAAFCWIVYTSQNIYEYGLQSDPARDTTLYRMLLAHAGFASHNEIFINLCREMDLTIKEIKGYKKNITDSQIVVSEEWSWPVVLVNGTWRFVDVDFAANVIRYRMKAVDNSSFQYEDVTTVDVDEDCEFYFLTDPDEWVFSHCALDPEWQMLARIVTYTEFKQMAHLTEAFFVMGFTDIEEAKGIIESEKGDAAIDFTIDNDKYINLSYDMKKISGKEMLSEVKNIDLDTVVTINSEMNHKIMDITLVEIGRYWLKIWATDISSETTRKKLLGQWFLECKEPKFILEPNPKTYGKELGQSSEMDKIGLRLVEVVNKDGFAHVTFESTTERLFEFMHSVESNKVKKTQLRQYVRHYVNGKDAGVVIIFPKFGKYILNTFVKEKGSTKKFKHVFSILLNSQVAHADLTPFPPSPNSKIGYLIEKRDFMPLTPISHAVPYFKTGSLEPVTLKFQSKEMYDVMTQCEVRTHTDQEDISNYTWLNITKTSDDNFETNVVIRFPHAGMYCFSLFARHSKSKTMIHREVYKYIIIVDQVQSKCMPYPTTTEKWDPRFELIYPKEFNLLEQKDIEFSVKIPNVTEVLVFHGDSSLYQNLQDNDFSMDGKIKTLNGGNDMTLSGQFVNDRNVSALLEYMVLTEEEWLKFEDKQKSRQNEATERMTQTNKRKQDEIDAAKDRDEEEKRRAETLLQEFEDEKEELYDEQTKLQEEFQEMFKEQVAKQEKLKADMNESKEDRIISKEIKLILEAYDSEIRRRRRLYRDMASNLTREKLREAIQQMNYKKLQKAIAEYHSQKLPADDPDITTAERLLDILTLKQELLDAIAQRDIDLLISLVDEATVKGYHNALEKEVTEAQDIINSTDKFEGLKYYVLGMEKNLMSELKSYGSPPRAVHTVMKAALLLLGEDESTTSEWGKCAMMCNPYGTEGLHWRVQLLNVQRLHPEIVSRSKEIILNLQHNKVQKVSLGAALFYEWASGTIDEYESVTGQDLSSVRPANIDRQRELLGKAF